MMPVLVSQAAQSLVQIRVLALLTAGFPLTGNGVGTPPLRAQAELWADRQQALRCGTLTPFPAREPRHVRFEKLRTDAKQTVREAFRWIRA